MSDKNHRKGLVVAGSPKDLFKEIQKIKSYWHPKWVIHDSGMESIDASKEPINSKTTSHPVLSDWLDEIKKST